MKIIPGMNDYLVGGELGINISSSCELYIILKYSRYSEAIKYATLWSSIPNPTPAYSYPVLQILKMKSWGT